MHNYKIWLSPTEFIPVEADRPDIGTSRTGEMLLVFWVDKEDGMGEKVAEFRYSMIFGFTWQKEKDISSV